MANVNELMQLLKDSEQNDIPSFLRQTAPSQEPSPQIKDLIMQGVGDPANIAKSPALPPENSVSMGMDEGMRLGLMPRGVDQNNPDKYLFFDDKKNPMNNRMLTQADGTSIPQSIARSNTPLADAYPSLNAAIMKRVGDPTNIPGIPQKPEQTQVVPEAPVKEQEEVKELPKQAAKKVKKEESVAAEEATSTKQEAAPEQKRSFDTEEDRLKDLASRYKTARDNADHIAHNIQSNENMDAITGLTRSNKGLELRYNNELGKAQDAKLVIDERRLEQKHSIDMEKAIGQVDDDKAARNPNSDVSKSARDILRAMSAESGISLNIPDNMPYNQLKEMFKPLETFMQARANQETRKEAASMRQLTMQMAQKEKEDSKVDAKFDKVSKMMVEDLASGRTVFGKNANIVRSADAINQLVVGKSLSDINPQQFYEMAKSLDAMLSMGNATITGTQKLMPRTALQDFASFKQYLSGKPQGMQTPEFVKSYMDLVKRERDLATSKITNAKESMLFPVLQYKDTHPEKMEQLLRSTGLPLDILEKTSRKKQEPKEEKTSEAKASPKQESVSSGTVTLRSKLTGSTLSVPAEQAKKFLEDPNIEEVK